MSIYSLKLKNFKSYQSAKIIFHEHLNLILGKNGHGKSNIFKAFLFVFSNKVILTKGEFDNLAHKGISLEPAGEVEVIFEVNVQNRKVRMFNQQFVKIGRRWTADGKDSLLIDGKGVDKKYFSNVIESLGLSYSDSYNIIQQGTISQIVHMNQHDLYKILQESAGIRRYHKNKEEAGNNMAKVQQQKVEFESGIRNLTQRFDLLEVKKKEFQEFEKEDNYKKRKVYQALAGRLKGVVEGKEKAMEELSSWNQIVLGETRKKGELKEEIDTIENIINILNQKIRIYQPVGVKGGKEMESKSSEELMRSVEEYREEQGNLEAQIARMKGQYESEKRVHEESKKKLEAMQMDKELSKSSQRAEMINESIKEYDKEIQSLTKSIAQYQKHLGEVSKIEAGKTISQEQFQQLELKKGKAEEAKHGLEEKVKRIKIERGNYNRRKNVIEVEKDVLRLNLAKEEAKINNKKKSTLHNKLMGELKTLKINGVYGYVADHLTVKKQVAFAYEIAMKQSFFTILVENDNVARVVIEANRRIKGSQINIISLSYFRQQPLNKENYPSNSYTFPLLNKDWLMLHKNETFQTPVDFEECMDKILNQLVGGFVLVETYSQGLNIAKENNLNCITSRGESVAAGAIYSKVGEMDIEKPNKLLCYEKVLGYRGKLQELDKEDQRILKEMDNLDNEVSSIMRQMSKVDSEHKKAREEYQQGKIAYRRVAELRKETTSLEGEIENLKREVANKRELKQRLVQKRTGDIPKVSTQELSELEQEFKSHNRVVNLLMEEIFNREQELIKVVDVIHREEEKIAKYREIEEYSKIEESMRGVETAEELRKQIEQQTRNMTQIHATMINMADEIMNGEGQVKRFQERLSTIEAKEKEISQQMEAISKNLDVRESTNQDQILEERIRNKRDKINTFTKQDKILFMKLGDLQETTAKFREKARFLNIFQERFKEFVAASDESVQEEMEVITNKFIDVFKELLSRLDDRITPDVTIKKFHKNNSVEYKRGLDIRIGFQSDTNTKIQRKMGELSGGQKSLVAIAFLISIQMCNNPMFYIFDEVDAALDSYNNTRVSKLLVELSENCQYFITTFKPFLVNEGYQKCSYFEVSNNARVSRVKEIGMESAITVINECQMMREAGEGEIEEEDEEGN